MSNRNRFKFPRTLLIIWIGILAMGFFNELPGLGCLFLLGFIYVIFMDRINEGFAVRAGKANKISDIEYQAFVSAIGGYKETPTSYLAEKLGMEEERVITDLMRLMDRKYFVGAYFDENGDFIVPANKKSRYDAADKEAAHMVKCPYCGKKIPAENSFCFYCGKSLGEVRELEVLRKDSLARIGAVAKSLPEGAERDTIEKIGELTDKILKKYQQEPDKIKDSSKFREYYLPKTISAMEYYERLNGLDNLSASEEELKGQIEDTLKVIENAFSNILRKMSTEGGFELSADVAALESVLERDGLVRSAFDITE